MTKSEIGLRIKQKRKEEALTQTQLATAIGISRSTIQAIEDGRRAPSRRVAARTSEILDMPLADLIESPPSEEEIVSDRIKQITESLVNNKTKRAMNRMAIVEMTFWLSDDKLPMAVEMMKNLLKGGNESDQSRTH